MSGGGRFKLLPSWRDRWLPSVSLAGMGLGALLQFIGRLQVPGHPSWMAGLNLVVFTVCGLLLLLQIDHVHGGIELSIEDGAFRLTEFQARFLRPSPRILAESTSTVGDLRYLESQHGVILKGPSFHRDLILPKDQAQDLIAFLHEQGVQRFSLAEASA